MTGQTPVPAAIMAAHRRHERGGDAYCDVCMVDLDGETFAADWPCESYRLAAALAAAQEREADAWDAGWKALEVQLHEQQPHVYWFDQPNPHRTAPPAEVADERPERCPGCGAKMADESQRGVPHLICTNCQWCATCDSVRAALAGEGPAESIPVRSSMGCGTQGPLVSAPCIRLAHDDGKHDDGRGTRWFEPPVCPSGCECRWADDADRNDCACDGPCCTEEFYLMPNGAERPEWTDPFDRGEGAADQPQAEDEGWQDIAHGMKQPCRCDGCRR